MGCLVIVLIVVSVFLLSWIGSGLTGPLSALMVWLESQWPWPGESASLFVLTILFISFRLLLTPYYLKVTLKSFSGVSFENMFGNMFVGECLSIQAMLLAAADCVFMFLIASAIHNRDFNWFAVSDPKTEGFYACVPLLVFFFIELWASVLSLWCAKALFKAVARQAAIGVLSEYDKRVNVSEMPKLGILKNPVKMFWFTQTFIYYPSFVGLWIAYPRKNDVLFAVWGSLVFAKMVTVSLYGFVSLVVTWRKG